MFLPKQVPLRVSVIKVKEFLNQHFYAIEETRGIGCKETKSFIRITVIIKS